ncbi:MAG TPA: TorF family putative porin [Allosphingosinicella sp.]|nr:TorF family putative porin [Allosphingosinicella sp.]
MPEQLLLAAALLAAAQEAPTAAPGAFEVSGEASLMSDYRFRGISRSDEDPTAQAGLMLRHESGLYAGARGTILRGNDPFRLRNPAFGDQGDAQLDLYAGYGADLGGGFDLDAGLVYYAFIGGDGATDHAEPYASLSYLIGPAQFTGGAKYAPSQAGTGHEDMLYLYGRAEVSVPFRPWAFTAEAGRQDWGRYGSYWTWSLGARYHVQLPGVPNTEIGLSYVDTDLPPIAGQDAGVRLTLELTF